MNSNLFKLDELILDHFINDENEKETLLIEQKIIENIQIEKVDNKSENKTDSTTIVNNTDITTNTEQSINNEELLQKLKKAVELNKKYNEKIKSLEKQLNDFNEIYKELNEIKTKEREMINVFGKEIYDNIKYIVYNFINAKKQTIKNNYKSFYNNSDSKQFIQKNSDKFKTILKYLIYRE